MSALAWLSPEARAELEALIALQVEAEVSRRLGAVPDEAASPYMTIPEAATFLRCKRQRVDDLLSSGRLTRHKDGGRTLVSRLEIQSYLDQNQARRT